MSLLTLDGDRGRKLTEAEYVRIGAGARFRNVMFSKIPKTAEYRGMLETFLRSLKKGIDSGFGMLLFGAYGSGKTSASVIVAKAVVSRGGTAFFIRADDLVRSVIEKVQFDDESSVEERMRGVDLLVIDDLGSEHVKDFGKSLIEQLVRWRYDHKKSLIATMNTDDAGKLASKFNEGLVQVMRSMTEPVLVAGVDWREGEHEDVKGFFKQ